MLLDIGWIMAAPEPDKQQKTLRKRSGQSARLMLEPYEPQESEDKK